MKTLKKDLQVVTKELKALTRKTEKLTKAVDKLEKAQDVRKRGTKGKGKTSKKAPAKRVAGKKLPVKKSSALTGTQQVLNIVKRSKKGVDVPALMRKTGFDEKKVRNVLSRAFSQKKIRRIDRGIYVAV